MTVDLYPQLACKQCAATTEHRFLGTERGAGRTVYECVACHSMHAVAGVVVAPIVMPEPPAAPVIGCAGCLARDKQIAERDRRLLEIEGVAGGWMRAIHKESAPTNGAAADTAAPSPGAIAEPERVGADLQTAVVVPLHAVAQDDDDHPIRSGRTDRT